MVYLKKSKSLAPFQVYEPYHPKIAKNNPERVTLGRKKSLFLHCSDGLRCLKWLELGFKCKNMVY